MSEQYFLEKCIISAEDAKGGFTMMSHLDLDEQTKQMYKGMALGMSHNLHSLNERMKYIKSIKP